MGGVQMCADRLLGDIPRRQRAGLNLPRDRADRVFDFIPSAVVDAQGGGRGIRSQPVGDPDVYKRQA